jgi:hypothetical protein
VETSWLQIGIGVCADIFSLRLDTPANTLIVSVSVCLGLLTTSLPTCFESTNSRECQEVTFLSTRLSVSMVKMESRQRSLPNLATEQSHLEALKCQFLAE